MRLVFKQLVPLPGKAKGWSFSIHVCSINKALSLRTESENATYTTQSPSGGRARRVPRARRTRHQVDWHGLDDDVVPRRFFLSPPPPSPPSFASERELDTAPSGRSNGALGVNAEMVVFQAAQQ